MFDGVKRQLSSVAKCVNIYRLHSKGEKKMKWNIDPAHSQVTFSVRHMMISNARGRFEKFNGSVEFDPNDLSSLRVDVAIDTASINTREEARDNHLRSDDFFASDRYPTAMFRSTGAVVEKRGNVKLQGDLTIRETTRPVTLDVEFAGLVKSPWGTTNAGFSASTKINRKDWGLTWNQVLEAGGLLVGDEVRLEIELELIKEQMEESELPVAEPAEIG